MRANVTRQDKYGGMDDVDMRQCSERLDKWTKYVYGQLCNCCIKGREGDVYFDDDIEKFASFVRNMELEHGVLAVPMRSPQQNGIAEREEPYLLKEMVTGQLLFLEYDDYDCPDKRDKGRNDETQCLPRSLGNSSEGKMERSIKKKMKADRILTTLILIRRVTRIPRLDMFKLRIAALEEDLEKDSPTGCEKAFLNGDLVEEIYMKPLLEGFICSGQEAEFL
ncbi:hypothetical protein Tco_1336206 [Tanacetum coccineum]